VEFSKSDCPATCGGQTSPTLGGEVEGGFALDSSSNGINPAAETVELRLFKPDGSRNYPVGTDKMPVAMVPITGGWSISAAEKTRTGIQDFQILQTGDPSFFVFKLVDTRTSLPQGDYNQVRIEMVSSAMTRDRLGQTSWKRTAAGPWRNLTFHKLSTGDAS